MSQLMSMSENCINTNFLILNFPLLTGAAHVYLVVLGLLVSAHVALPKECSFVGKLTFKNERHKEEQCCGQ